MTARVGDDMPQTPEALAARVRELEELLVARDHRIDDLEDALVGARQSVTAEQRARQHDRLVARRPAGGWPPIPAADNPGGAT